MSESFEQFQRDFFPGAERQALSSRCAVMKYRAYTFMQAARLLEMKLNACRAELDGLRHHNEQLRRQLNQT